MYNCKTDDMPELVKCPLCGKEIEADSFYCDQCGEELKLCGNGHGFKKGKVCSQCGQPLVKAKFAPNNKSQTEPDNSVVTHNTAVEPTQTDNSSQKTIRLTPTKAKPQFMVGKSINARLPIKEGAVIGRRTGDYVSTFASQGYVSGTHARIQANADGDYEIIDLDSTNGTFVNGSQIAPNKPTAIHTGDEIAFYDTTFIIE
ncbi:FHA domain-containing protein [Proteiniphilum sp. UBA7639]|jgi:hypothetical protein|uniref:FHA domain-containing protein n=2 Tax=Dysgonomonadaceae TaxID=2005520 RepID=UPI00257C8AF3|nr:FHA domain-containing protein [Proteiniphilum sp. UBA7639]